MRKLLIDLLSDVGESDMLSEASAVLAAEMNRPTTKRGSWGGDMMTRRRMTMMMNGRNRNMTICVSIPSYKYICIKISRFLARVRQNGL